MSNIKVMKRVLVLEDFRRDKIKASIAKAGVTDEQAETITVKIEEWVPTVAVDGVVNSSNIRMKVLELLRPINPDAAANFGLYQKFSGSASEE